MLHLLPQISRYYGRSRTSTTRCIKTTEQMGSYLMAKFAVVGLRARHAGQSGQPQAGARRRLAAGGHLRPGQSGYQERGGCRHQGGTDAVVLCHNHPNGVALPSLEDMDATGSIARALGLVNVHLLDHFILTDTEYFPCGTQPPAIYDFKTGTLFWP